METKCEESETICEAVFKTNGLTCEIQCQSLGLVCEDGWDETSNTCVKKTYEESGCGTERGDQICRCTNGKSIIKHYRFITKSSIL